MTENMPIRYEIDFHTIPSLFYENKDGFCNKLLLAPEYTLPGVYSTAYRDLQTRFPQYKPVQFCPFDFLVQKKIFSDDRQLVYVSLPEPAEDDGSHVYCEAFALVQTSDGLSLYTIEKSVFGTSCIGMMDERHVHLNLGKAGTSVKENVDLLCGRFFLDAGEPTAERMETLQPNGGKVAMMINNRDNTAEIHEYDACGNPTKVTYGTLSTPSNSKPINIPNPSPEPPKAEKAPGKPLEKGIELFEKGSYSDAIEVFQKAGELGDSKAQNRMGIMYYAGLGIQKDYHCALTWFKKAANQGNAEAMRNLAILYDNGEGTLKNPRIAQKWYEQALAANPSDIVALNNLGLLYLSGSGIPDDHAKGEALLRKAADLGFQTAAENLTAGIGEPMRKADLPIREQREPVREPLTVESIAAYHGVDVQNVRLGETPNGGVYSIVSEGGGYITFTEYDENHEEVFRTTGTATAEEEETVSEPDKPEMSPEEKKAVMAELLQTIISCSSPPLTNDFDDRARWLMGRIEYFRNKGIPEKELYILEVRILQYMPDFAARNFKELYRFLNGDITPYYLIMEYYLGKDEFAKAKKVADPLAHFLEQNKARLIDGHHCNQNDFECAMYTLENKKIYTTPSTKDNYTAFLVAYARILQNTRGDGNELFRMTESRKYLNWAQSMSPQNASVWLYMGASYNANDAVQLDFYKKALHYCFLKDGPYGLTAIYKYMALSYFHQEQIAIAAALRDIIHALGDDAPELTFLLAKCRHAGHVPFKKVLQEQGIQIGFSDLVQGTAEFLASHGKGKLSPEMQELIDTVRTLRL